MKVNWTAVLSVIALLITGGFVGTQLITPENISKSYVCEPSKRVAIFEGGLSSTGLRGYPLANSTRGYIDCKTPWITFEKYSTLKGVNISQLEVVDPVFLSEKTYICSPRECIEK